MSDQMTRCTFCGETYHPGKGPCPACAGRPIDGWGSSAEMVTNRRINVRQAVTVATLLLVATVVAIALTVADLGQDETPIASGSQPSSTTEAASQRRLAWATDVSGAVSSTVNLPDAVVVSTGESLTRIDADGREAWITNLEAPAEVVATSQNQTSVVAADVSGIGVGAYDVDTGTAIWTNPDLSYVATVPGGTLIRAGFGPFGLVSDDGDLVWRVEANEQVAVPVAGPPAETVYVRTGTTLDALDAVTGVQLWSVVTTIQVTDSSQVAMAATDGMIVLGTGGQIVAYDSITGAELWTELGNGITPQIEQFGPNLVAVALDGEPGVTLYDPSGPTGRLQGDSNAPINISSFEVGDATYAANPRSSGIYDARGKRVKRYPPGVFTAAPDGFFVTAEKVATHYRLDGDASGTPDYAVPAPDGAMLIPLEGGVVVATKAKVRGY